MEASEHESLRDRFIRIAGATDIRSATLALNDAGERLSRYFVSQFSVNLAFGLAIWVSLSMLRLSQALLCGILAGVMRFVPYVGVGIAAVFATLLALAVDPGWSLAMCTLVVFILLDIVVGQLVEPHLYGHATGLSPLSVVVAAIFWSWLWGPAGLILSTPLTLCLLVAGRRTKMAEAVRWGKRGARVNTISPGIIVTALAKDELSGPRGLGYRRMIEESAAGRAGTPDEVAAIAALLMGTDACSSRGAIS